MSRFDYSMFTIDFKFHCERGFGPVTKDKVGGGGRGEGRRSSV